MTFRASLAVCLCLLGLSGCGAPPPAPTLVTAVVTATADANGGAPVAVRLYQLQSPAAFNAAEFFPLFNGDAAALKDDLVKRDDLLIAPGTAKTLALAPPDRATAIGVFAAFKDYAGVTWHVAVPVPAHATSSLLVSVTKAGVSARVEPVKP